MTDAALPVRPAARIILFDAENNVLLFRYRDNAFADTSRPDLVEYWLTPGGGLDPGESHVQAAHRELREETGFHGLELSHCVARRSIVLRIHGIATRCEESFFFGRVTGFRPSVDVSRQFAHELDVLREVRWCPASGLHTLQHPVVPDGLAAFVAQVAASGLPEGICWLKG